MQTSVSRTTTGSDVPPYVIPGFSALADDDTPEQLRAEGEARFLEHLPTIRQVLATTIRQHRMSFQDAEDLESTVLVRIIDRDYAVLRKFRGQCSWRTYLSVVIGRMYLDFRVAQWGKWRGSAVTRRSGDVAVLLERLTMRDGLPFGEACSVLAIDHGLTIDRDTLARLYATFRERPRAKGPHGRSDVPSAPPTATGLVEGCSGQELGLAITWLDQAVSRLAPQDRRLLQLRFGADMSVADVARTLGLNQQALYRRYTRLLSGLRRHLEEAGVSAIEVMAAIGSSNVDVNVDALHLRPVASA